MVPGTESNYAPFSKIIRDIPIPSPRAAMKQVKAEMRRGNLMAIGYATFTHSKGVAFQKDPVTLARGWWTRIDADDQMKDFWSQGSVSLTKTKRDAKAEITGIMLDASRLDEILAPHAILAPTPPSGKSRKGANAYRHGEPITYVAQYLASLPAAKRNEMTAMGLGHILGQAYQALGYNALNQRNLDGIAAGILHAMRNPIDLPKKIQDWEENRQSEARPRQ